MNYSELSHLQFIELLEDKKYVESIKNSSKQFIEQFDYEIKNNLINDPAEVEFLKLLLVEGRSNYYLQFNDEQKAFILLKRNLKGMMIIGHNTPLSIIGEHFSGVPKVLELIQIHSVQKGEGRKMLKTLIKLAKALNLDIVLWAETEKNTKYFESYGFENLGSLGDKEENLMVYNRS